MHNSADKCMSLVFREEGQAGDINLAVITAQMAFNFTDQMRNTKAVEKRMAEREAEVSPEDAQGEEVGQMRKSEQRD